MLPPGGVSGELDGRFDHLRARVAEVHPRRCREGRHTLRAARTSRHRWADRSRTRCSGAARRPGPGSPPRPAGGHGQWSSRRCPPRSRDTGSRRCPRRRSPGPARARRDMPAAGWARSPVRHARPGLASADPGTAVTSRGSSQPASAASRAGAATNGSASWVTITPRGARLGGTRCIGSMHHA